MAQAEAKALRGKMNMIQAMLDKGCDWNFIEAIAQIDEKGYTALKAKMQE